MIRSEIRLILILRLLALSSVGAAIACAPGQQKTSDVSLLPDGPPYRYLDADWAFVLNTHVKDGLVDYDALRADPVPLQRYVALLGATGPATTPGQFGTTRDRTAYWINAYNACVLYAVLGRYPITTMYDLGLPRLETGTSFLTDGSQRTLRMMELSALEASGDDVRIHFALSRAAIGTPRLMNEPFKPAALDRQLDEAARLAMADPAILQIDRIRREILVWQLILRHQDEIVSSWQRRRRVLDASLLAVLTDIAGPEQRQELQAAAGYAFWEMPFNRALNRWSPHHRWPVIK